MRVKPSRGAKAKGAWPRDPPPPANFSASPACSPWPRVQKQADGDGEDCWLTLCEAQPALRMFQEIAEADRMGASPSTITAAPRIRRREAVMADYPAAASGPVSERFAAVSKSW
jgi:hypothetical protein